MLPCGAPNALGQLTADFVRRHPKGLTFPPLEWLRGYGELDRVGVEGTGIYGVALTRYLREAVRASLRSTDRIDGPGGPKASPIPSMPTSLLEPRCPALPRSCPVEAIRSLRVARSSAVKARSQATNQIKALTSPVRPGCATAPPPTHWDDHCGLRKTPPWPQSRRCRTGHQDRAAPARTPPSTAIRRNRRD
jgi:hypothetical protein